MDKEFYMAKFGDKYLAEEGLKEIQIGYSSIILKLTDNLFKAQKLRKDDFSTFDKIIKLGGRIVEISMYQYDKTYTIENEIEEDKKALENGDSDD